MIYGVLCYLLHFIQLKMHKPSSGYWFEAILWFEMLFAFISFRHLRHILKKIAIFIGNLCDNRAFQINWYSYRNGEMAQRSDLKPGIYLYHKYEWFFIYFFFHCKNYWNATIFSEFACCIIKRIIKLKQYRRSNFFPRVGKMRIGSKIFAG